jgi:biotin carboxyl carrier protein
MRRYQLGLRGREFVIDVQEIDAERFEVIVGDEHYEVTLSGDEDLPEAMITPGYQPRAEAAARAPTVAAVARARSAAHSVPMAPAAPKRAAGGSAATLNAPMPGVILELHVKAGDTVQRGQQVAVLDAMKMHNFIGAPRAGTIAEVCVEPGQAVGHGDPIVRYLDS